MKKLLQIIATPRGEDSRTLKVSEAFLEEFKKWHPDWEVEKIDLFKKDLAPLTVKRVDGKYILLSGENLSGEYEKAWQEIIGEIERFSSADVYLISTPMWNFSIPYVLKHYIDLIIQPKYLFHYTEKGPQGLLKNKRMVVITSRGGDYSGSDAAKFDFQEHYLRAIFGFVGITDMVFINAQPMDALGIEVQKEKIEESKTIAKRIAIDIK